MSVITISRQRGCGGTEISRRLCELLGYTFFDKSLMVQVAADVGMSDRDAIDFSEDNYKVKGFLTRLFSRGPRPVPEFMTTNTMPESGSMLTVTQLDESRSIFFIRRTILAAYERSNVVILGRGGQAVLKDMPDVLHVRLVAPEGARVRRIQARENISFSQAYQMMVDRDQASVQFLDEFFGLRADDPALYHLMINTGKIELEAAAQIIVATVHEMQSEPVHA